MYTRTARLCPVVSNKFLVHAGISLAYDLLMVYSRLPSCDEDPCQGPVLGNGFSIEVRWCTNGVQIFRGMFGVYRNLGPYPTQPTSILRCALLGHCLRWARSTKRRRVCLLFLHRLGYVTTAITEDGSIVLRGTRLNITARYLRPSGAEPTSQS